MQETIIEAHKKILNYLKLDKPIIFFDLETTGANAHVDKIVEVSAMKLSPEGNKEFKAKRLNPEMPIPEEATKIHGIKDEDVKDCPTFKQIAKSLYEFFGDCHLGGYGITHFDIRVLQNEFERVGIEFTVDGKALIDAKSIYFIDEPRDLSAALKYYCNKEIESHHSAKADVDSSIEVLLGQFEKNKDKLPGDIYELNNYCNPKKPEDVDRDGKFKWFNNEVIVGFGKKHNGKTLKEIVKTDSGYLEWILKENFSKEVKDITKNALQGKFPERVCK